MSLEAQRAELLAEGRAEPSDRVLAGRLSPEDVARLALGRLTLDGDELKDASGAVIGRVVKRKRRDDVEGPTGDPTTSAPEPATGPRRPEPTPAPASPCDAPRRP